MDKYTYLILLAVLGIAACGKEDQSPDPGPVISILSPTPGQMINAGDSVPIHVLVTDDDMHEIAFRVALAADTSIQYFEAEIDTHDDEVHYMKKFEAPAVLGHTDVILFVHAEDHDGHASNKSVTFGFMP